MSDFSDTLSDDLIDSHAELKDFLDDFEWVHPEMEAQFFAVLKNYTFLFAARAIDRLAQHFYETDDPEVGFTLREVAMDTREEAHA